MATVPTFGTVLLAGVVLGAGVHQAPSNATGPEIILKFAPDSRADADVAKAAIDSATPSPAVVSHVTSLGRALGVPLDAKRLGSGGTVIVGVRTAELSEAIAQRIRREPFVTNARGLTTTDAAGASIEVELARGSAEAKSLKGRANEDELSPAVKRVADKLERTSRVPLTGAVDGSGRLLLTLQLDAAVNQLVTTLNKRAGIQYAQLQGRYTIR